MGRQFGVTRQGELRIGWQLQRIGRSRIRPTRSSTLYGIPIEPRNFNRAWHAHAAASGVPRITVNDGRRTYASLLVDLEIHPRTAMQVLGPVDFWITMEVYSQVASQATRDALERFGESLDGA